MNYTPGLQQLQDGLLVGGVKVILLGLLCFVDSVPPTLEEGIRVLTLGKLLHQDLERDSIRFHHVIPKSPKCCFLNNRRYY